MDETQPRPSSSITVLVITAIVALLVGYGVAKAVESSNSNSMMASATPATNVAPTTTTKAADLRSALVGLGVEHMQLTNQAIDAALDGNADAPALKTSLIANGTSISGAIGSIYGSNVQTAFQGLWNAHLTDFVNYAVAGKKGDAAGKKAAMDDINANYTVPIAKLLSGANPNLPNATLLTAFGDHVTMTAAIIDDHNAGNYTKEATDLIAADTHIQGLMSTLAGAIVTQYPEKF